MKNILIFTSLLFVFSCHDKPEDMPVCADILVDTSRLSSLWSIPFEDQIEPIIFEGKILFIEPLFEKSELYCFDGSTGQLLWQKTILTYLLGDEVQISGSKLYYTNGSNKTFRSIDLHSLEDVAVCTVDAEVYLGRHFALGDGYAIFLATNYLPSIDSTDVSAYLVDLQSGVYRQTTSFRAKYSFNGAVMFDPTTEITPSGDTLLCFMEYNISTPSLQSVHRFASQNIQYSTISATAYHQSLYASNNGNLILENGKAYFALGDSAFCLDASSLKPIWKRQIGKNYNPGIGFKSGHLFVFDSNRFLDALDPFNGESLWQSPLTIGSVESLRSSFVYNGRLYLVEDYQLTSVDVETGCWISNQPAPSNKNLLSDLGLSLDEKMVYVSDFYHLFGVPIKE